MELIEKVSINSLSKRDLLLIIKSLEYTNENTQISDFIDLRNNIDFLDYLEKNSTL